MGLAVSRNLIHRVDSTLNSTQLHLQQEIRSSKTKYTISPALVVALTVPTASRSDAYKVEGKLKQSRNKAPAEFRTRTLNMNNTAGSTRRSNQPARNPQVPQVSQRSGGEALPRKLPPKKKVATRRNCSGQSRAEMPRDMLVRERKVGEEEAKKRNFTTGKVVDLWPVEGYNAPSGLI